MEIPIHDGVECGDRGIVEIAGEPDDGDSEQQSDICCKGDHPPRGRGYGKHRGDGEICRRGGCKKTKTSEARQEPEARRGGTENRAERIPPVYAPNSSAVAGSGGGLRSGNQQRHSGEIESEDDCGGEHRKRTRSELRQHQAAK